jgi:alpha-L-fucosidase 2
MDNQLIRELFGNTMEAAEILGLDSVFVQELAAKRDKLMPTTIGKDGRIMEWLNEYEEAEVTHRHVSHLYGLHPGNEISVSQTPELAKAARATLEKRGDASTGWSMAWKVNFWARLHDGDRAHKLLSDLLRPCLKSTDEPEYSGFGSGTYPNLFCAHPPFQIDGNFGGTAGIAEMLIQSQTGIIELLPALPSVWRNGSFRGLKVRGGAEVDVHWTNNRVDNATLRADVNNTFRIKIPAHAPKLSVKINGESKSLPVSDGFLSLTMRKGDIADLIF